MRPGDIIVTVFAGGTAFLIGRKLDPSEGRGNREELGMSQTLDVATAKACAERSGHNVWIINEDKYPSGHSLPRNIKLTHYPFTLRQCPC